MSVDAKVTPEFDIPADNMRWVHPITVAAIPSIMDRPHRLLRELPSDAKGHNDAPRETILEEAQRLIHGARQEKYGHPLDDYTRTAALFNAAFASKLREPMQAEDMMLAMILVKVSRQVNLPERDNMTDVAGYAGCIELAQDERKRRSEHEPARTVADTAALAEMDERFVNYEQILRSIENPRG